MIDSNPGDGAAAPTDEAAETAEQAIARAAAEHERMAIDNDTGIARPSYDQYAVNDPESTDKLAQQRAREAEIEALAKTEGQSGNG